MFWNFVRCYIIYVNIKDLFFEILFLLYVFIFLIFLVLFVKEILIVKKFFDFENIKGYLLGCVCR